jgi:hypothetical protein
LPWPGVGSGSGNLGPDWVSIGQSPFYHPISLAAATIPALQKDS